MSVDYWAMGALEVSPPVPLDALRELVECPYEPLVVVPYGTTSEDTDELDGEWFAVAAVDADTDDKGRPETIGEVIMNYEGSSSAAHVRLIGFAACCETGTDFDGEIFLEGENHESGVIAQTTQGELDLRWITKPRYR